MEKKKCTAIILAGGQGKRMGTSTAKQYLLICGKPVLYYSLAVFEQSELIDEIVLVVGKGQEEYCRQEIVEKYQLHKVKAITEGGAERYHSVWAGLCQLEKDLAKQIVFIHDGARPFVTEEILERVYEQTLKSRACVVGMPVKDTMKIASESGWVQSTPKRKLVWQVQTPQVFAADLIVPAYRELIEQEQELLSRGLEITDDAMVAEIIGGCPVKLVEGSYQNIKITTPEDLEIASIFLGKKSEKN
jgi:2-C-methyl-D-erythritol 4-phosphate cytidylyltransferase